MAYKKTLTAVGSLLDKYKSENKEDPRSTFGNNDKYISREFQKYAYDLAIALGDLPHKSLYMKLAKITPRILLENAKSFVMDATTQSNKGRLFMWKLKQLKIAAAEAQKKSKDSNVKV